MSTKTLLRVTEALFSLNVAALAMLAAEMKPNRYLSVLLSGEANLKITLNHILAQHPHSNIGGNIAFLSMALIWAIPLFLLFQISVWETPSRWFFNYPAGVLSLIALPLVWLLGRVYFTTNPDELVIHRYLIFLELLIALICGIAYAYGFFLTTGWITSGLLVLHFFFWCWVIFGSIRFWLDPFRLVFPLLSAIAAYAWGVLVSRHSVDRNVSRDCDRSHAGRQWRSIDSICRRRQ